MEWRFLLAAITLCLTAVAAAAQTFSGRGLNFLTVHSGIQSNTQTQGLFVLRSQGELEGYWQRHHGGGPAVPISVDWGRDQIVAVHLGRRNTGGFQVLVQRIEESVRGDVIVHALEIRPTPGTFVTQALTSPFVLVRFDRTTRPPILSLRVQDGDSNVRPGPPIRPIPGPPWITPPRPLPIVPIHPTNRRPFRVMAQGTYSQGRRQELVLIRGEQDLRAYWRRYHRQAEAAAPTNVDWIHEVVVAVHLGTRPTGGYAIFVQGVEETDRGTVIRAIEETPWPGSWVSERETSPWVLIRVSNNLSRFVLSLLKG